MKKRLLSILLVLCMVLALFPGTAWAADTSGTCGDDVTWSYNDGTLSIQGIGSMDNYAFRELPPWNDYCEQIHTVSIDDGVTSIGNYAFNGCGSLINIIIPDSVTIIGDAAFEGCSSLLNVTIPDSVTAIKRWAFRDCSSLTSVTIPLGVLSIEESVFSGCSSLTSVAIPTSVTNIGYAAFHQCNSLTDVTIPNSVTSIGAQAFEICDGLTSVIIPNSVTSIGYAAFSMCSNLTSVTISDAVSRIDDNVFRLCSNLTSVTIPNSVKSIGVSAFADCFNLTSVIIPDSVTSIEFNAFGECRLADVYYSGSEADWNAIDIGGNNGRLTNATIHYNSTGPDDPDGGELGWGDNQYIVEVGKTLTLTVRMEDGSALDANKLVWTLDPALGTAEIVDEGQVDGDAYTAYVTLKGIYPGKVTLTGTLAPNPGESILNRPMVRQEITVIGNEPIRFDKGDSYTVTVGETFGDITVTVPNPNGLSLNDITFTSSDEEVVRVAVKDQFDLTEIELLSFTLSVSGLKAGTVTITASAADGRSASCTVTVQATEHEISFDPDIYHANWLRNKSVEIKALDRDTPSILLQDPVSGVANNFWVAFSTILSLPSEASSSLAYITGLSQRDMYEALLLDALQATFSYDITPKILKDGSKYANKIMNYITEQIKTDYRLDINSVEDYRKYVEEVDADASASDYLDDWFKENHLGWSTVSNVTDCFSKGMKFLGNVEDLEDFLVSCMTLAMMDEQTRDLLNHAHEMCLADKNYGPMHPLTLALAECIEMYDDGSNGIWASLMSGTLKIAGKESISYVVDKLIWKNVLKKLGMKNPNVALIIAAISAGKTLTKIYFNTDDVAESYLDMQYITDIESVFDRVYSNASAKFANTQDVKSANLLLEAMRLSFQLRDEDCEIATKFQDSLNSGVLFELLSSWGITSWGGTISETKESIKTFQNSYRVALIGAETNWINYLEEDYPNSGLYEQYEHLIDEAISALRKEVKVQCPVNVYIYDSDNTIVAYAVDGRIGCSVDNLIIAVEGDEKTVCFLNEADYRIECVGYESGYMDMTIMEYDDNENIIRSVSYNDLPVTVDGTYTIEIDSQIMKNSYELKDASNSEVTFDYDSMQTDTAKHTVRIVEGIIQQRGISYLETTAASGEVLEINAFVPDGYTFVKWECTDVTAKIENPTVESTTIVMPDEDIVISAIVNVPAGVYTIQFDFTDGTMMSSRRRTGIDGKLGSLPTPTLREGYTFDGWYTKAEGGNQVTTETVFTEDTTVYAHWTKNSTPPTPKPKTYTVTLSSSPAKGGSVTGSNTYDENESVTVRAIPAGGYRFVRWTEGGTTASTNATYTFTITKNRTLTAVFEPISYSGGDYSPGDSSSSDPTYSISVPSRVTGGTIKVTPTSASERQRVTITVKPNTGYELDTLTVTDSKGNTLTLTEQGDGKYTFIMPSSKVSIDASFKATAPAASVTTINFTDVQPSAYYYDAVAWAVRQGITSGTTSTTFTPDAPCTRAQIVSFLWRAAGSPKMSGTNPFVDVAPSAYYYDAVLWAVANGITAGSTDTTFSPDATCTRAQSMTFLYRAKNSPAVSGTNRFTDLVSDAYYMDAVQWAANTGVTSGTTNTTFSPDQDCTRAQIMSFLYRDRAN